MLKSKLSDHRRTLINLRRRAREMDLGKPSQKNRVAKVVWSMLISNGLTIALQLLMVPALIHAWGVQGYGEWLILYTIPGYLALADLGIITTANNKVESLCTKGNFCAATRTYFNSILLLCAILSTIGLIGIVLTAIAGSNFTGLFQDLSKTDVYKIEILLFIDTAVLLTFNHHTALYRTLGKFNQTVNWQASGRVFPTIGLCIAALSGASILTATFAMLISRFFFLIVMLTNLVNSIYWLHACWFRLDPTEIKRLLKNAASFMTIPISNMIYLHATTLIVASVSSPTVVATFGTMRTFTRMIPQIVSIAGRSNWSEITQAQAKKELGNFESIRKKVLIQTFLFTGVSVAFFALVGPSIYKMWTGGEIYFEPKIYYSLVTNSAAIALCYSVEVFLLATNRAKAYALATLSGTITQIILGYTFISIIGISALPLTSAIISLIVFLYLLHSIMELEKSTFK